MNQVLRTLLVARIADRLTNCQHVAVGASSPIPAAAALLAKIRQPSLQVSLLGSESQTAFTDGGRELFDCAAQGRIDYFFFSGVQIDGQANINLVGRGDYPQMKQRFAGSFGSAYLYFQIPRIILFCWAHSLSTLVEKVDFVSAPGPRDDGVWRRGGPVALLTDRCEFDFEFSKLEPASATDVENPPAQAGRFVLRSLHAGETVESVRAVTGFEFDVRDESIPQTVARNQSADRSSAAQLAEDLKETEKQLIDSVLPQLADSYPRFVQKFIAEST